MYFSQLQHFAACGPVLFPGSISPKSFFLFHMVDINPYSRQRNETKTTCEGVSPNMMYHIIKHRKCAPQISNFLVVSPQGRAKGHQSETTRDLALPGSIKPEEQEDLRSKNEKLEHSSMLCIGIICAPLRETVKIILTTLSCSWGENSAKPS